MEVDTKDKSRTLIIGHGSLATALIYTLPGKLNWYVSNPKVYASIKENKLNNKHLSYLSLKNSNYELFCDLQEAINESSNIFVVLPSIAIEKTFENINLKNSTIISFTKGILPISAYFPNEYYKKEKEVNNIIFASGPSHAEDISLNKLTALTFFSENLTLAHSIKSYFPEEKFKTYIRRDIHKAEMFSTLKNIMAIFFGMVKGSECGENLSAVLMCEVIKEINHTLNLRNEETLHYSYLGDLLVTCYSELSRNFILGKKTGLEGSFKNEFINESSIPEGVYAIKTLHRKLINTPICDSVYNVIYGGKSVKEELEKIISKI